LFSLRQKKDEDHHHKAKLVVVVINPVVNLLHVQDQNLENKVKVVVVVVIVPIQKVDHDRQVKLIKLMVEKITNHHKINPNHPVKIRLLVVNHHKVDHGHQAKLTKPMVERITNHHKINHQVKVKKPVAETATNHPKSNHDPVVVVEKVIHQVKINLVDQVLVHQVNHKIITEINKKVMIKIPKLKMMIKILKQKMNKHNNNNVDELKVVKNDQTKVIIMTTMNNINPNLQKRNHQEMVRQLFIRFQFIFFF
jgi:hypothetical protein